MIDGNSKTAGGAPTIFSTPLTTTSTTGFDDFALTMDFDKK